MYYQKIYEKALKTDERYIRFLDIFCQGGASLIVRFQSNAVFEIDSDQNMVSSDNEDVDFEKLIDFYYNESQNRITIDSPFEIQAMYHFINPIIRFTDSDNNIHNREITRDELYDFLDLWGHCFNESKLEYVGSYIESLQVYDSYDLELYLDTKYLVYDANQDEIIICVYTKHEPNVFVWKYPICNWIVDVRPVESSSMKPLTPIYLADDDLMRRFRQSQGHIHNQTRNE